MKIKTRDIIITALFTALMVVGAFIKIPFPLVPLTFQPFFCAFAGILLGSRLGVLSQALYVIIGLAGLPVFTSGGGITYVLKPSFGYLIGFIAAAYLIGRVYKALKVPSLGNILISVFSGLFVIFLIGIPYSYIITKFYLGNSDATLLYTLTSSLLFIAKDSVLYIIVAVTAYKVIPVLKKTGLSNT